MCFTLLGCSINHRRSTAAYAFNVACSRELSLDHASDCSQSHMYHAVFPFCMTDWLKTLAEAYPKVMQHAAASVSCSVAKPTPLPDLQCPATPHSLRCWRLHCSAGQGMCIDKVRRCACYWSDIIYHVLYMLLLLQSEVSMFLSAL